MNTEIDINKVNEEKEKLAELSTRLTELGTESVKSTNILKDAWESKSSEKFYEDYEKFKKDYETYCEELKLLINYLQDVVATGYKEFEVYTNKIVDENFSTI